MCFSVTKSVIWWQWASFHCLSYEGAISQKTAALTLTGDTWASLQVNIHRERKKMTSQRGSCYHFRLLKCLQAFFKSWVKFTMWPQVLQECGFESCQPQPHQSQGRLLVASGETGCGASTALYQVISCLNTLKATTCHEAVGHIQGAYARILANLSCC